jgi:hypothetical protein
MSIDQYTECLAKIRSRFAAELSHKIDSLDHALPQLSGKDNSVIEALDAAHRGVLELCSTGPAVGFVATGKAARSVQQILYRSLRAKRGLSDSEVTSVLAGLGALRVAAQSELHSTSPSG